MASSYTMQPTTRLVTWEPTIPNTIYSDPIWHIHVHNKYVNPSVKSVLGEVISQTCYNQHIPHMTYRDHGYYLVIN